MGKVMFFVIPKMPSKTLLWFKKNLLITLILPFRLGQGAGPGRDPPQRHHSDHQDIIGTTAEVNIYTIVPSGLVIFSLQVL